MWCDSDNRVIDGEKVWAYSPIFESISVDQFDSEVARFQATLLDAMAARIDAIEQGGQLAASVHVDIAELRGQHRTETVTPGLRGAVTTATDWDPIMKALSEISSDL